MHDTVGIVYQDVFECFQENPEADEIGDGKEDNHLLQLNERWQSSRRRKGFNEFTEAIEPYYKKPRMTRESMISLEYPKRAEVPASVHSAKLLDLVWMASVSFQIENTPTWTGWNSKFVTDLMPMQQICYLTQLGVSPTSNSAMVEIMKMSKRIAEECNQQYM